MPQAVIENPIFNPPWHEPTRHFQFDEQGITSQVVEGRRQSAYFIPIAQPRKKGQQLSFDTEWTEDRLQPNPWINRVRERVGMWRQGGHVGITNTTRRLLEYWTRADRELSLIHI